MPAQPTIIGQIDRQTAKDNLRTGKTPGEDFFHSLMDSIVFKHDNLRELFFQLTSEIEAQQGTDHNKMMTALRTAQHVTSRIASTEVAKTGESADTLISPKVLKVLLDLIRTRITKNHNDQTQALNNQLQTLRTEINNLKSQLQGQMKDSNIGQMCFFASDNSTFNGWYICRGASLHKNTYSKLFNVIGYTYGGGGDYFQLPNPQARMLIMKGGNYYHNYYGGSETHTLSHSEMPSHYHSWSNSHSHGRGYGDRNRGRANNFNGDRTRHWGQHDVVHDVWAGSTETAYISGTTDSRGSGYAHNNMPPYYCIGNLFIYTGVF